MPPVIITEKLSCQFEETTAVDQLSLQVHAGEIFGCLGHNGAAKTTTVRLLYFSNTLVWLLGLAFWLVDITLLWYGSRTLGRTQMARRL